MEITAVDIEIEAVVRISAVRENLGYKRIARFIRQNFKCVGRRRDFPVGILDYQIDKARRRENIDGNCARNQSLGIELPCYVDQRVRRIDIKCRTGLESGSVKLVWKRIANIALVRIDKVNYRQSDDLKSICKHICPTVGILDGNIIQAGNCCGIDIDFSCDAS